MTRLIAAYANRERNTSIGLYDTGSSFELEIATAGLSRRRLLDELPYEGQADRRAARAMARGTFASVRAQIDAGILEG